jgi:hypothetical protein
MDVLTSGNEPDITLFMEAISELELLMESIVDLVLVVQEDNLPVMLSSGTISYTVTSTDITYGFINLTGIPNSPSTVRVDVSGGCSQQNGVDFTVSGTILSWAGLGMATVISAGDVIIISF